VKCCGWNPPLRGYLLEGQFFLAAALASTLTKLCIRYFQHTQDASKKNVSSVACHEVGVATSGGWGRWLLSFG